MKPKNQGQRQVFQRLNYINQAAQILSESALDEKVDKTVPLNEYLTHLQRFYFQTMKKIAQKSVLRL